MIYSFRSEAAFSYQIAAKLKKPLHLSEVESSRTSLASRTSPKTHFEVLGFGLGVEGQVLAGA